MVPIKPVSDLEMITKLFTLLPQYPALSSPLIFPPTTCWCFSLLPPPAPGYTDMSVWLYGIRVLKVEGFNVSLPQMIFPPKRNTINLCSTSVCSGVWEKQMNSFVKNEPCHGWRVFQPVSSPSIILSTACNSIKNIKVLYSEIGSYSRMNSYSRTLLLLPDHYPFRWDPYNIEELSTVSFGKCKSEMHPSDPNTKKLQDMLT